MLQCFADKGNLFAQRLLRNIFQRADIEHLVPIIAHHALGRETLPCHRKHPCKAAAAKAAAAHGAVRHRGARRDNADHRFQVGIAQSGRAPLRIAKVRAAQCADTAAAPALRAHPGERVVTVLHLVVMRQPFAAAAAPAAHILHHHGIAAPHIAKIGLRACVPVVGGAHQQRGNGQGRAVRQVNVRCKLCAVAHNNAMGFGPAHAIQRAVCVVFPQRQRRFVLKAVAHQKAYLLAARAEPRNERSLPKQRVPGKLYTSLNIAKRGVFRFRLRAGIAHWPKRKGIGRGFCRRLKVRALCEQKKRPDFIKGVGAVICRRHRRARRKREAVRSARFVQDCAALRCKTRHCDAGGIERKLFHHYNTSFSLISFTTASSNLHTARS